MKTGYPDKFPYGKGFTLAGENFCQWCVEGGEEKCGIHKQSPIDLKRDRAVLGGPNEKDCPDWHWMPYIDDSCTWDDMVDQFTIERHALQLNIPQLPNGDIDCNEDGRRKYPRMDYSKGFPDYWWLQRTSVMVPSQHTQEGTRYAAEVILAHFYEIAHYKNQVSVVCNLISNFCQTSIRLIKFFRDSFEAWIRFNIPSRL